MITGDTYTVRFSYWGYPQTIWERSICNFKAWRNGSRVFSSKAEADEWIKNQAWKEYEKFHHICTEYMNLDSLSNSINAMNRSYPHSQCSDESIVKSYSR